MANVVTTQELKRKIESGTNDYFLVDVLGRNSFDGKRVPTSLNVPYEPGFVENFGKETGAPKDADIIVYCSSASCMLSPRAAADLEKAGYSHVSHYKDGLAGWQEAGYEFESGARSHAD